MIEKLGKQGYHYDIKESFEPITKTVTDSNQKQLEETKSNSKALENFNEKVLESMNDKGMIAPYLASSSVNLFKPENKSHIKVTKELSSAFQRLR